MSNRDKRRSAILSNKVEFKKEIVKVNGEEYEVRQPSQKSRSALFKKSTNEEGKIDNMDFMIWGVIYNTYDPESGELVFEDTDYNTLVNLPAGGALDKLGEATMKMLNVEGEVEKK